MTSAQENKIIEFLLSTDPVFEVGNLSLESVVLKLDTHVPSHLDRNALEVIGVAGDEIVTVFACERGTCVGGNLLRSLGGKDLTLSICHAVLIITSRDAAETRPLIATRIYDITPLIERGKNDRRLQDNFNVFASSDGLIQSIQQNIEPDAWEALGGLSTMSPYSAGDHVLLTVTTSSQTQLNVQAYLDRLNHASRPSVSKYREQSPVNAAQLALETRQ